MRRKQRHTITIRASTKTTTKNPIGETIEGWGDPVEIKHVTVTPIREANTIQMYGERASSMRRIICDGGLTPGMGVWLPGETGDPPWVVESAEPWNTHLSAVIERRVV